MNMEISVVPVSQGEDVARYTAEVIKIVQNSGMEFSKTPLSIVLTGEKETAIEIAKKCHQKVMSMTDRAITRIRTDETKT